MADHSRITEAQSVQAHIKKPKKSNATAGFVQVEANLPGTSTAIAQFLLQMHFKKMFALESD